VLFWRFIGPNSELGAQMSASYDPLLVILSFLTAFLAGYTALEVVDRMGATSGRVARSRWLFAGGLAMGSGIWAMHFIGMLAFSMHGSVNYDLLITFISMVPGVFASITALWYLNRRELGFWRLNLGGFLMASGIGGMHFAGMEAMIMDSVMVYDPYLFVLSIAVAHILATAALHINFQFARKQGRRIFRLRLGSAVVMGSAVACMHYTGMGAAEFYPGEPVEISSILFEPAWMALAIALVTSAILGLAILATVVDRMMAESQQREERIRGLNHINEKMLHTPGLNEKMVLITEGIVEIFDADFARIWLTKPGDHCNNGCIHASVTKGPNACVQRDRCLHLVASSGRYTHIDGEKHSREPRGVYKIGRIASEMRKFQSDNVIKDQIVEDRAWAKELGLVSFAGYPLISGEGKSVGVLALFSKYPISPEEDALLETISDTAAQVIQASVVEEAKRVSDEQVRLLLDFTAEGIYGLDLDGNCTWSNTTCLDMLGYETSEQILGKNMHELIHHTRPDGSVYPMEECLIFKAFRQGEGSHVDDEFLWRADGSSFPAEYWSFPVRREGEVVGSVVTFVNIADRKHAEEELALTLEHKGELERQLLQKQKMAAVGTLAGGIAHDFNNILHIVLGFTKLAKHTNFNDKEQLTRCLDQIEAGGTRAADLVTQLLAFSRAEKTTHAPVNLEPIVNDAMKFLRSTLPSTVAIVTDVDDCCYNVLADSTQIHQILMNLCTNAAQAMETTGGILRLTMNNVSIASTVISDTGTLEVGDYVLLAVQDEGYGIEPDKVDRIFEPFFTTKERGKGTGLGLATVHGIVRSMGGIILLESEPGKGTLFKIYFPRSTEEHVEPVESPVEVEYGTGGGGRVLVVDDEEAITTLATMLLESNGFRVDSYNEPERALDGFRLESDEFDFAIFDLTMPGKTGIDLAADILQLNPRLPIILATGLLDEKKIDRSRSPNIVEVMKKPFNGDDLMATISRVS